MITGVPATGKTTISQALAERLGYRFISEKDLLTDDLYEHVKHQGGLVKDVDIEKFDKIVATIEGDVVLDGILFPETCQKFDAIVVLYLSDDKLRIRMAKRGYSDAKIEDNVFAQNTHYLLKKSEKRTNNLLVLTRKSVKSDVNTIVSWLHKSL